MSMGPDHGLESVEYSPVTVSARPRPAASAWRAGWAPLAVLALHQVLLRSPWRTSLNGVLHALGGCAAAYFVAQVLRSTAVARHAPVLLASAAFTSASTVAVFWELGEYAGDRLRDTRVQMSLDDTMRDLAAGVTGAGIVATATAVRGRRRTRR